MLEENFLFIDLHKKCRMNEFVLGVNYLWKERLIKIEKDENDFSKRFWYPL